MSPQLSLVVVSVCSAFSSKCCYTLVSSTHLSLSIYYMFNSNGSFHAIFPERCMPSGYCSSNFPQQDLLLIFPRTLRIVLCITADYILSANCASPLVKATIPGSKKLHADPILFVWHISQPFSTSLKPLKLWWYALACHQIGELLISRPSLFDWQKIIKCSTLDFLPGHARYHLPYHKSDPFFQGTTILLMSQSIADHISLLLHYVSLWDQLHGACAPLFLTKDGSHPTQLWFEQKFFTILDHSFGGQSAHAGGATFYASLGISEDMIQAIGHWASATWKIYLREHPTVYMEQQLASACLHPQPFTQQLLCALHDTSL